MSVSAEQERILGANTPGRNTVAVAELAIGLMISIARYIRAGGGFDVFGRKPLPDDRPFLTFDNVALKPHLGGATGGVVINHSRMAYEDIQCFLNDETPALRAVNSLVRS